MNAVSLAFSAIAGDFDSDEHSDEEEPAPPFDLMPGQRARRREACQTRQISNYRHGDGRTPAAVGNLASHVFAHWSQVPTTRTGDVPREGGRQVGDGRDAAHAKKYG